MKTKTIEVVKNGKTMELVITDLPETYPNVPLPFRVAISLTSDALVRMLDRYELESKEPKETVVSSFSLIPPTYCKEMLVLP